MLDPLYYWYMTEMEKEDLNKRAAAVKQVAAMIKKYPDKEVPTLVLYAFCGECGIKPGSLTDEEMKIIEKALKKKRKKKKEKN